MFAQPVPQRVQGAQVLVEVGDEQVAQFRWFL